MIKNGYSIMQKFFALFSILCCLLLQPSFAQRPEDREPEKNPYLQNETSEPLDLLQRYQQRQNSRADPASRSGNDFFADPERWRGAVALAMEGPIDPNEYVVGPADVLAIAIGGVSPFVQTTPVTPEGILVIPTVGEVLVAGQMLAAAKKNVREAVRRRYNTTDIGVHLVSMRTFRVTVVGAVAKPGTHTVAPVDRVGRAVLLANQPADAEALPVLDENSSTSVFAAPNTRPPVSISLRNIKLYRSKKDTIDIDLVRYHATGETHCNPYLRDGDVIFVPAENLPGNTVSVSGGVRRRGVFEFHEGDSLRTLLRLAQGPTALADLQHVEVARFLPDGRQVQMLTFNLQPGQNGQTPDLALQRNDRIYVRENPELRKERTVRIFGAVTRPGEYALLHDRNMLSEIIARAGGFAPNAAIAEAKLIRNYKNPDEMRQNPDYVRLLETRLMDLKPNDREYFNYEAVLKRGFVAVDFARLFARQEKTADVEVWEDDEIYVPLLRNTINVYGQVINPGYVAFAEGMDHRDYIEKAGGFSTEADRGKVRILKRDTNAWLKPGDTKLEPGDQIFVSRLVRRPASVYFNTFRDVIQTTASIATVYLLYQQVTK
jgi:protein involved in polysaccharide export with SLBB domain